MFCVLRSRLFFCWFLSSPPPKVKLTARSRWVGFVSRNTPLPWRNLFLFGPISYRSDDSHARLRQVDFGHLSGCVGLLLNPHPCSLGCAAVGSNGHYGDDWSCFLADPPPWTCQVDTPMVPGTCHRTPPASPALDMPCFTSAWTWARTSSIMPNKSPRFTSKSMTLWPEKTWH